MILLIVEAGTVSALLIRDHCEINEAKEILPLILPPPIGTTCSHPLIPSEFVLTSLIDVPNHKQPDKMKPPSEVNLAQYPIDMGLYDSS